MASCAVYSIDKGIRTKAVFVGQAGLTILRVHDFQSCLFMCYYTYFVIVIVKRYINIDDYHRHKCSHKLSLRSIPHSFLIAGFSGIPVCVAMRITRFGIIGTICF